MHQEIQTTDMQARLYLPSSFAGTTVVIEQISDTELSIRQVTSGNSVESPFTEETSSLLSDRDRDLFLELLTNPPPATLKLQDAFKRQRANHE